MDVVAVAPRHPRVGETIMGSQLHVLPGGKGLNQAVAARRSGVATSLVSRLGRDVFAAELRAFLQAEDVGFEHTKSIDGARTGVALVVVAEPDNSIVFVPGADGELSAADSAGAEIRAEDVVVAQFESPQDATAAAFARAHAAGARTVLNPAPALPARGDVLEASDVIVVNALELAVLLDGTDARAVSSPAAALDGALRLRRSPAQTVVVTLGVAGVVALTADGPVSVRGHAVRALDTTGAGDCFVGNLAAGLCRGHSVERSLREANLAASLCVQKLGAAVSMPTAEELRAAHPREAEQRDNR